MSVILCPLHQFPSLPGYEYLRETQMNSRRAREREKEREDPQLSVWDNSEGIKSEENGENEIRVV